MTIDGVLEIICFPYLRQLALMMRKPTSSLYKAFNRTRYGLGVQIQEVCGNNLVINFGLGNSSNTT